MDEHNYASFCLDSKRGKTGDYMGFHDAYITDIDINYWDDTVVLAIDDPYHLFYGKVLFSSVVYVSLTRLFKWGGNNERDLRIVDRWVESDNVLRERLHNLYTTGIVNDGDIIEDYPDHMSFVFCLSSGDTLTCICEKVFWEYSGERRERQA